jgi:hypothetical protein
MLGSVRFYEMEILERRGLRAVKKLDALRQMRKETERDSSLGEPFLCEGKQARKKRAEEKAGSPASAGRLRSE